MLLVWIQGQQESTVNPPTARSCMPNKIRARTSIKAENKGQHLLNTVVSHSSRSDLILYFHHRFGLPNSHFPRGYPASTNHSPNPSLQLHLQILATHILPQSKKATTARKKKKNKYLANLFRKSNAFCRSPSEDVCPLNDKNQYYRMRTDFSQTTYERHRNNTKTTQR